MIEQNIIGVQSDLKYTEKRLECAKGLRNLASRIVFHDMFNNEAFLSKLVEDAADVSLRRFVISAPRDNFTEPFRFSSRHSEFVRLKAKALLAWTKRDVEEDDEFKRYKVVIQYPDHSAAQSMLHVKPHQPVSDSVTQAICNVEQFVELMQNYSWTEAANIEIFIARAFSQTESSIMSNLDMIVATQSTCNGTGCSEIRMLDEGMGSKGQAKQKTKSSVIVVSNIKKYLIRPL